MTLSISDDIRKRVAAIKSTPAIPAVFLPLLDLLNMPSERVKVEDVVKLVSYDNTISMQCLRVAGSPLFGLARTPQSIRAAVISLGLRRVQTILLTCCLGQAFSTKKWAMDPTVFWSHSLGCAMVCRKFSDKLGSMDGDKAYMAGLLHDIGFMVNCMAFSTDFAAAMKLAVDEQIPLHLAEFSIMGFTHCETGAALAEKWNLNDDIVHVIAHHHNVDKEDKDRVQPLVALVHLSDLLCRVRGLGYGYYERQKVDMIENPAWTVLLKGYKSLESMDLVRFTFELDEAVQEIREVVAIIFGSTAAAKSAGSS
jgi:putative nucleotidyltransferase with HDIG domain